MELDSSSRIFLGVHFVLYGFNSIDENEVLFKLVSGGGVDVGQYSQSCTHVIVDKLVYDDTVCVAARNDGKVLVTGLWVNHSYDLGAAVNSFSIMYRPVVDLNGIPGAKRLTICLTGYQRQDRDDVMTMVSLMGAKFSKPLIAHKVTHLICYKFEGEKYELARRLKTMKLVNHRWLEDCLRHWVLLPEANYNTSGYDLENVEFEAKDSEEESDNNVVKHIGVKSTNSPITLQPSSTLSRHLSTSVSGTSSILPVSTILEDPKNIDVAKNAGLVPVDDNKCTLRRNSSDIDISCSELADIHLRTPVSKKISDDIVSPSLSANTEAQYGSRSYSRRNPRKSTLLHSVGRLNNLLDSPVPFSGSKVNHSFDPPLFMAEPEQENNGSGRVQTPEKGAAVSEEVLINGLPQKRTSDPSNNCSLNSWSNPVNAEIVRLKITPPSLKNDGPSKLKSCDPSLPQNSPHRSLVATSTCLAENSFAIDPLSSRTSTDLDGNVDKILQRSLQNPGQVVSEYEGAQNQQQDVKETSSSDKNVKAGKLKDVSINFLKPGINSLGKSPRKKNFFKKSLGSRPKVGLTANQKGSIHFRKEDGISNCETFSGEGNPEKFINAACVLSTGTVNNKVSKDTETKEVSQLNIESVDDETEAPDNMEYLELEKTEEQSKLKVQHESNNVQVGMLANAVASVPIVREPKSDSLVCDRSVELDETKIKRDVNRKVSPRKKRPASKTKVRTLSSTNCKESMDGEVIQDANTEETEEQSELKVQHESNNVQVGMLANAVASVPIVKEPKSDSLVCDRSVELDETKIKRDVNRKVSPRKKRPASKTKVRTLTSTNCKESMDGEVIHDANTEEIKEKPLARAKLKTKSCGTLPADMSGKSIEVEKENRPIIDVNQNVSLVKKFSEKPTIKSNANSRKTKKTSGETNSVPVGSTGGILIEIKNEPAWFILSGHRLQRKMFQQNIRLLKGRYCKDSHHWSYQATHFIIPDPIRRTEKFFAATASGRWVLKTDYLTASKQAGRFIEEEPYEWYENGLSEDGAINFEAPRKWRHLREKTGHGAFHGMKIIIYGECIAPPLDTLKRVVKAGDGTILATSPPYTRFLTSEVDFAIVSPGIPRVDIWVQEFLKHEIPCVVADYLVEYVCKPGYPLEKHVLYNTQPWAEKSFNNLQKKAEEVAAKVSDSENDFEGNDIACRVCESHDRGEVMLICGDESGSAGCGVGMHIDCCDPPLQVIPEDDWFCPECVSNKKTIDSPKKRRRQRNSSKME